MGVFTLITSTSSLLVFYKKTFSLNPQQCAHIVADLEGYDSNDCKGAYIMSFISLLKEDSAFLTYAVQVR